MKSEFRSSFTRDLKRISDRALLHRVARVIEQVEQAPDLETVQQLRKLAGAGSYYRIRLGDYRIGLAVSADVVVFVRFLHRRDIYRHFP